LPNSRRTSSKFQLALTLNYKAQGSCHAHPTKGRGGAKANTNRKYQIQNTNTKHRATKHCAEYIKNFSTKIAKDFRVERVFGK